MPEQLRAITLVIASQRSGSTLLCRDIESLGGMGAPKEHFLDILSGFKSGACKPTEQDVREMIARGATKKMPHVGAVKLMVNYAPKIDGFIRGAEPVGQFQAVQNIIDWAHASFEHVNLVALVRSNPLDQAISRAVARQTDIWHRRADVLAGEDLHEGADLNAKALNSAILRGLPNVISNSAVIRKIARSNSESCLLVQYEELANSVESTSKKITDHARKFGFSPKNERADRHLKKLIDDAKSQRIKADFKAHLERQLDLW